jgi:hypothetical protein
MDLSRAMDPGAHPEARTATWTREPRRGKVGGTDTKLASLVDD